MALTALEKANIVMHLGWPGLTIIPDTTGYNNTIVRNLTLPSAQMEIQIRSLLQRIEDINLKLESASCRLSAKEIGDITLRDDEIYQLKKEKIRLCRELSALLDIEYLSPMGNRMIGVCV